MNLGMNDGVFLFFFLSGMTSPSHVPYNRSVWGFIVISSLFCFAAGIRSEGDCRGTASRHGGSLMHEIVITGLYCFGTS